jgi:sugar O-acyltransferase (sialic acid O-acetyltransferase NeuD family)
MKKLIIVGASGFGREVAWIVERINDETPSFEILGFSDDAEDRREGVCGVYPLLGPIEAAAVKAGGVGFFCAVGNNRARQTLMARALSAGLEPVTLVDREAVLAPGVELGRGCFIGVGSVVSVGTKMGDGVIVNHQVTVGHDVTLGDFAQLCPGVRVSGGSTLGEGALMGSNACTIPCVRIGAWATVGAGAAALRDVQEGGSWVRLGR